MTRNNIKSLTNYKPSQMPPSVVTRGTTNVLKFFVFQVEHTKRCRIILISHPAKIINDHKYISAKYVVNVK